MKALRSATLGLSVLLSIGAQNVAIAQRTGAPAGDVKSAPKPTSEIAPAPPPIGVWGQHGLNRSYSSDTMGHAMTVTLSANIDTSYAYDVLVGRDSNFRFAGHLSALFIPLEYLVVSATYHMLINTNDKPAPGSEGTLQLLGDINLDLRGVYAFPLAGGRLGLSLGPHLRFLSGSRSLFEPDAFSAGVLLGGTYVFPPKIPLKLHLNLGAYWDRTRFLLEGFRTQGDTNSSLADLYSRVDGAAISAYGISVFSPVYWLRIGAEVTIKNVVPWIEYSLDLLSTSQLPPYLSSNLKAGEHPQHLSLGARAFVTRDRALTVGGAIDFGFNGGRFSHTVGAPGQLPWNFIFNLAYTFGRAAETPPPVVITETKIVRVVEKTTGKLVVTVIDETTRRPLSDAEVHFRDPRAPSGDKRSLTNANGQVKEELSKGVFILRAERFSHLPSTRRSVEVKAGLLTEVEIVLIRKVNQTGLLVGQVTDVGGKPLKATIVLDSGKVRATCSDDGKYSVGLPPGKYQIEISFPGHIRFNGVVEIVVDTQVIQDTTLHKDN